MKLTFQMSQKDQFEVIHVIGAIDEDAEVPLNTLSQNLSQKLIFNLHKVSKINSCGVRAWINFMRVAQNNRQIIFEECPPEIISQINMIPNFKGQAEIKSLYASYTCEGCNQSKNVFFEKGKNLPANPSADLDPVICDHCGEKMDMDELEEEFFSFLDVA